MRIWIRWLMVGLLICGVGLSIASAQDELAAVLTVLDEGVEVLRAGTVNWIAVRVEAIVGVGDIIRTNEQGRARITYFSDGVETIIEANSEYRIDQFQSQGDDFNISATVLVGETLQRLGQLLGPNSSYDVNTPSVALVARGTVFRVRVEPQGRAALLVDEGIVAATAEAAEAEVPSGFGIRADAAGLSEVVPAVSFDQLDSGVDGCAVTFSLPGDVSLNVRLGADLAFPLVGTVLPIEVDRLWGTVTDENWYRIAFRGGYGWLRLDVPLELTDCAGLRPFPSGFGPEDISAYNSLGNPITLENLSAGGMPSPTPTAAPGGA